MTIRSVQEYCEKIKTYNIKFIPIENPREYIKKQDTIRINFDVSCGETVILGDETTHIWIQITGYYSYQYICKVMEIRSKIMNDEYGTWTTIPLKHANNRLTIYTHDRTSVSNSYNVLHDWSLADLFS